MSDSSGGESGLTSPSVPLEIIIPAGASILVFLSLTIFLLRCANRARNARAYRLARSPSLCVFADRERNRKWLEELRNLKELGLNSTLSRKLNRSSCFERNSQGKDDYDAPLFELPVRPRSAFLSGRETASSFHRARANRKTWERFSSLGPRIARPFRAPPQIPEIHVTVDSTEDVLAFQRAWSETFERDIGLAVSGMLDKPNDASRSSPSLSHPPQNYQAHRRLSSTPNLNVTIRAGPGLQFPMDALPPIRETREIWGPDSRSRLTSVDVDRGPGLRAPVLDSSQYLSPRSAAYGSDYDPIVFSSVLLPSPQSVAQSISGSSSSSSSGSFTERASEHGCSSSVSGNFESLKNSSSVGSNYLPHSLSKSTTDMSLCSAVLARAPSSVAILSSPAPDSSAVLSSPSSSSNTALPVNSAFTSSTPFEPTLSLGLIFDPSFSSYSFAASPDIKVSDATNASALPTPLIPAVYTVPAAPSAAFAQVASQSSLFPSKPRSDGGAGLLAGATGKAQGSLVSISGLAGVELWIDDDVDLFYYSGSG